MKLTGSEDHYGGMDFKVAGTRDEVTAVQLDVKYSEGIPIDVLCEAVVKARDGRHRILDEMASVQTRASIKDSAPPVEAVQYDPASKKDLVGPGGAVMKQLEEAYGVDLDLSQEGQCLIYGAKAKDARDAVNELVGDVDIGGVYGGVVLEQRDFGVVVEIMRNKEVKYTRRGAKRRAMTNAYLVRPKLLAEELSFEGEMSYVDPVVGRGIVNWRS